METQEAAFFALFRYNKVSIHLSLDSHHDNLHGALGAI